LLTTNGFSDLLTCETINFLLTLLQDTPSFAIGYSCQQVVAPPSSNSM